MVGSMLKCSTLTLKVVRNAAKCLNMTFHFEHDMLGCGYAKKNLPNLKIQIFKCPSELEIHKVPFQPSNKWWQGGRL